jgi:hypothetical protein
MALMPLPLPLDVQLFYKVRRLSKGGKCSQNFVSEVVMLASEFTRPQLASNLDMGTVYAPVSPSTQTSFRYVKGDKATTKELPEKCRQNAVEDYRTIVINGSLITRDTSPNKNTANAANEITVAYRKWGTQDKFPAFCISRSGVDVIEEVTVGLAASVSSTTTQWSYQSTGTKYSKADLKIVLV